MDILGENADIQAILGKFLSTFPLNCNAVFSNIDENEPVEPIANVGLEPSRL